MKRYSALGWVVLIALVPLSVCAAGLSAFSDDPQQFNGRSVTVRGAVANFHQTFAEHGGSFAMFSVCGGGCVRVYAAGAPKLTNGQSVTVSGTFTNVDRINGNVYYNQIDSDVLSIHPDNPVAVPH